MFAHSRDDIIQEQKLKPELHQKTNKLQNNFNQFTF